MQSTFLREKQMPSQPCGLPERTAKIGVRRLMSLRGKTRLITSITAAHAALVGHVRAVTYSVAVDARVRETHAVAADIAILTTAHAAVVDHSASTADAEAVLLGHREADAVAAKIAPHPVAHAALVHLCRTTADPAAVLHLAGEADAVAAKVSVAAHTNATRVGNCERCGRFMCKRGSPVIWRANHGGSQPSLILPSRPQLTSVAATCPHAVVGLVREALAVASLEGGGIGLLALG